VHRIVRIRSPSIRLDQFLKWAGIAATGGQAKIMIRSGAVRVNGKIVTERSRSLSPGDVVEVAELGRFTVAPEG